MSRPDPSTCTHRFDEGNPRRCALCDWDFTQGDPPDLSAASAVRSEGVVGWRWKDWYPKDVPWSEKHWNYSDTGPDEDGKECLWEPLYTSPVQTREDGIREAVALCRAEEAKRKSNMDDADAGATTWGADFRAAATAQGHKATTAGALARAIEALLSQPEPKGDKA
jgi:hypothetical protein